MSTEPNLPHSTDPIRALSVVVPQDETISPEPVPYYAATAKGWMVNVPNLFGVAQVLSNDPPPTLKEFEQLFHFGETKLPVHVITQAHDFFRRIWNKQKTESSAFICYNDETKDFKLYIPEQYVSGTSVNHKMDVGAITGGYRAVGTIHSHCNFGAFHSGTDEHDMEGMPGIHITLGHVDQNEPEIAIGLSINDVIWPDIEFVKIVDKEKVLDKNGYSTAPEWWDTFVHTGTAPWTGGTKWQTRSGSPKKSPFTGKPYTGTSDEWGWDAWSDTTYTTPYNKHNANFSKKWQQKQAESKDAFAENAAEIEMTEAIMNYEVDRLAMFGFAVSFNIRYDKKTADRHLAQRANIRQMHLEDMKRENRKTR
jgi:hypothetical protein